MLDNPFQIEQASRMLISKSLKKVISSEYVIRDEFKQSDTMRKLGNALNISTLGFSKRTGLSIDVIEKLLFMDIRMTRQYAERFSKAFNTSLEFWLN